jgi:PAS domain S-box-containing protein
MHAGLSSPGRRALRVALVYFLAGSLWIVLTDSIEISMEQARIDARLYDTAKGLAYVAVTALLFFEILCRELKRREQLEARASTSKAAHQALIDDMPALLTRFRPDGTIVSVNEACARFFGRSRDDLAGSNIFDRVPPEDHGIFREMISRLTPSDPVQKIEHRVQASDGVIRWQRWTNRASFGPDGALTEIQGVGEDTTDARQAAEALRLSEERYRHLVDACPDAIFVISDGRFAFANKAAFTMFRAGEASALLGTPVLDWVHPESQKLVRQRLALVLTTGAGNPPACVRMVRADGQDLWVESVSTPYPWNPSPAVQVIARDVTDRVAAEGRLRLVGTALDAAANGIVITDAAGLIQWVNPAFEAMTGYSMQEVAGKSPSVLKSGQHDAAFYRNVWDTITAGRVWRGEVVNRRRDGTLYAEEMTITPVRSGSGPITHFIAIKQDITQRKESEQALRVLNETLEERVEERTRAALAASEAKSRFLASMSHELRTPLNAIIGFSQMLLDGQAGALSDKQHHYAANIESSGQHLLRIISDILDLSKIEAGQVAIALQPTDIAQVLEQSVAVVQAMAEKKRIRIAVRLDPELPRVSADEIRIKQVVFNLLSNAIKYTDEGGSVTVRARTDYIPINPSSSEVSRCIAVSVADTGVGIPPADHGRIFAEFVQLDASYARRRDGTGLGLAVARRLVELHGGRIWLESDGIPGKGSVFTFAIPLPS